MTKSAATIVSSSEGIQPAYKREMSCDIMSGIWHIENTTVTVISILITWLYCWVMYPSLSTVCDFGVRWKLAALVSGKAVLLEFAKDTPLLLLCSALWSTWQLLDVELGYSPILPLMFLAGICSIGTTTAWWTMMQQSMSFSNPWLTIPAVVLLTSPIPTLLTLGSGSFTHRSFSYRSLLPSISWAGGAVILLVGSMFEYRWLVDSIDCELIGATFVWDCEGREKAAGRQ